MARIHPDLLTVTRPAPRRRATVALAVAGAFHAGLLAWLMHQTFQPAAMDDQPDPGFIVTRYTPPPPPETPQPRPARPAALTPHATPAPTITTPVLPVTPIDKLVARIVDLPVPAYSSAGSVADATVVVTPPALPVVRAPALLRPPSASDLARFYPERALRLDREGRTEIACTVTVSGAADACRLISETPADYGFGRAALALARSLRFTPKLVDGAPAGGGEVRIPLRWTIDG